MDTIVFENNYGELVRLGRYTMEVWNGKEWVLEADYSTVDEIALEEYREGMISYDELPHHLQDQIRDDYLWDQADAMYDMMQEEGL